MRCISFLDAILILLAISFIVWLAAPDAIAGYVSGAALIGVIGWWVWSFTNCEYDD